MCVQIGLVLYLRASQYSLSDSISGVRCFIGVAGDVRLELRRVPGAVARSHAVLPGTARCLAFRVADGGVAGVSATVVRPKSCDLDFDVDSHVDFETRVDLPLSDVATDKSYVAIKQSAAVGFAAVDRFSITTRRPRQ